MAASVATFSTIPSSSSITDTSMTFMDLPGMSHVISAMPSPSTSNLKLDIRILLGRLNDSVRRAVFVQDAKDRSIAFEFQIRARIVRAFVRRARADFEQEHIRVRFVHDAVAVRHACFPAGAVAGLEDSFTLIFDQNAFALQDVDELVLLFVPMAN